MDKLDIQGNESVTKYEFVDLMKLYHRENYHDPRSMLEESLSFFAADGTDDIEIDQLIEICQTLGEPLGDEEKDEFLMDLKKCDYNNSGMVTISAFVQLMDSKVSQSAQRQEDED